MDARDNLKTLIRQQEEKEIEDFFENVKQCPVGERINRTYRYLKRYRKKKKAFTKRSSTIHLNDWVPANRPLYSSPGLAIEYENVPLLSLPTLGEIKDVISRLKNGKTPGVDSIYAEYFKYCGERTQKQLHGLLSEVWATNKLPQEWKHSVLVPIPKVKAPKTTSDYRQISLSCTAYKIYAMWLLQKLQQIVGSIGTHQAAFLPELSTTDHLFTLQRILQEYWNGGKPIILMSLDIQKAFDNVILDSLPAILKGIYL